ncbi:LysR family transcriptional regulator [uncultured Castellaniella sp.]|uniref:LysR family transcriptional regulator n=1 Tax=uncultured Castellaniella sp. TaxID=647907 RepID=UPI00260629EB|nr:LysR family transcriptional regulator [uncultured Castellaniella sp.]
MDRLMAARVFVTIAQRGSLTAAASTLQMSRAMVTRYLAEMENWAGARLFHRNTRHLGLTLIGQQMLDRSLGLLTLADQLPWRSVDEDAQMQGVLRVACPQALAQTLLAGLVSRFLALHPESAIELLVAESTMDLVAEGIDMAVRVSNSLDPVLIARPLGVCGFVLCAAPAYLARRGRPAGLGDLVDHNCLTYTYFGRSLWRFTLGGEIVEVPVSGNLSANDSMTLLSATQAGAGISLMPWPAAKAPVARGELEILLPEAEPQSLGIHAVYASREHQSVLMRRFLDFLVDAFARPEVSRGVAQAC